VLSPKRVKWRRPHKGAVKLNRGNSKGGNEITFGEFGLEALESSFVTDRQIEAARVAMTRFIKRGGKVWIKIFPHKSIPKKPAETRRGSGKGAPEYWVAVVKPGRILFELAGVPEETAKEALRLAAHKLPIKCKFVKREVAAVTVIAETGGETNEG
jgi:large subunit ribosomal protein L16